MSESTETALALPVLQNALSTEGRDPIYAMTPDERSELEEVSERSLIIKYDGKEGRFKNIDTEETVLEMTGAILGVTFSQAMFPPDGEEASWPKWICRSEDVRQKPYLHPELNQSQKAEALARGAGNSCGTCPARSFGDGTKPACTGSVNLMWADSQLGEIATVQASGTSITAVKHYLNWFKRRQESLLAYQCRLAPGEKQSKGGGKNWQPLSLQKGAQNAPEVVQKLRLLRQEQLTLMADRVRAAADSEVVEAHVAEEDQPEAPRPAPVRPQAPQPLRGRGVGLRPAGDANDPEIESALNELGLGEEDPFQGW